MAAKMEVRVLTASIKNLACDEDGINAIALAARDYALLWGCMCSTGCANPSCPREAVGQEGAIQCKGCRRCWFCSGGCALAGSDVHAETCERLQALEVNDAAGMIDYLERHKAWAGRGNGCKARSVDVAVASAVPDGVEGITASSGSSGSSNSVNAPDPAAERSILPTGSTGVVDGGDGGVGGGGNTNDNNAGGSSNSDYHSAQTQANAERNAKDDAGGDQGRSIVAVNTAVAVRPKANRKTESRPNASVGPQSMPQLDVVAFSVDATPPVHISCIAGKCPHGVSEQKPDGVCPVARAATMEQRVEVGRLTDFAKQFVAGLGSIVKRPVYVAVCNQTLGNVSAMSLPRFVSALL
jgi:hypothetical protein